MQRPSTMSVKEAAAALGLDERSIRERLINGQLRGEKRSVGLREKWFVYRREVEAALARGEGAGGASNTEYFGPDVTSDDSDTVDVAVEGQASNVSGEVVSLEQAIRLIAQQFAEKLDEQREVVYQLQRELEQKEKELRLLPDLRRQMEEEHKNAEAKALETEALKKQIGALEEEKELSESRMRALEEERRAAEEELKVARAEKEAKEAAIEEQLRALTWKLAKLERPWWKRWLAPPDSEPDQQ